VKLLLDESLPRRLGRLTVFQQSLPQFAIAVLVLRARTNRIDDLAPLVPRVLEVLPTLQPGRFLVIE
jgi:hypothetical protein